MADAVTNSPANPRSAVFFDVDGTLVRSTIVHYYIFFRRTLMSPLRGWLWQKLYLVRCLYYLLLDRIDRSRLNVVFYRDYGGLPVARLRDLAETCYERVMYPRRFVEAAPCIEGHRRAGRRIVLLTGSLDFIVEPLARHVGADHVVAAKLIERNGSFTGQLDGLPIGDHEKARRLRLFAQQEGIDLAVSHAYADSTSDLPMLEQVGYPHAVNPDRGLSAVAFQRNWPVHQWSVANDVGSNA